MSEGWQERAVHELDELTTRCAKLAAFVRTDEYHQLPIGEQIRLALQKHHMIAYRNVLAARVASHFI